jgi:hypothetical protein
LKGDAGERIAVDIPAQRLNEPFQTDEPTHAI